MMDVATAAGVSRALVSIVLRDVPGASEQTRAHVLATARRLGYVPDARAQALRQQGKPAIGVVFQPEQPLQAVIIDAIYSHAREVGYPVVLSTTTPAHGLGAALESLVAQRCGSLIVLGTALDTDLLATTAQRIPIVVAPSATDAEGVEYVASANEQGLVLAVEHLAALGHRKIVYCESPTSGGNVERYRGYLKAMAANGLEDEIDVVPGGPREEDGAGAAALLLARDELPTAVIAFNDNCAAGVQDLFLRRQVRVPEDVSLVGFDDSEVARLSYRSFTTIRQDIDSLGEAAVARAIARMAGQPAESAPEEIPTVLVSRTTTGPPRERG